MIIFEQEYFVKFEFTSAQIDRYVESALRDLNIAKKDKFREVQFTYCYQALIKIAIALIAHQGSVKVRSIPGHHVKVIMKLSEILKDEDVFVMGNAMRMKRNRDLYDAAGTISAKEVKDYIDCVDQVILKAAKIINVRT